MLEKGNAEKLGKIREKELYSVGKYLQFRKVDIVHNENLKDGMNEKWDLNLLANIIIDYIKVYKIDTVITFDEHGVSGHINHICVRKSIKYKF